MIVGVGLRAGRRVIQWLQRSFLERDSLAALAVEQDALKAFAIVVLVVFAEEFVFLSFGGDFDLLGHEDLVSNWIGFGSRDDGSLEGIQTDLTVGFELHCGHLEQLRVVFETIFGGDFGGQAVGGRKGHAQEVFESVFELVVGHSSEGGVGGLLFAQG